MYKFKRNEPNKSWELYQDEVLIFTLEDDSIFSVPVDLSHIKKDDENLQLLADSTAMLICSQFTPDLRYPGDWQLISKAYYHDIGEYYQII